MNMPLVDPTGSSLRPRSFPELGQEVARVDYETLPQMSLVVMLSHSRAHHTPYPRVHPRIIQRIVEIREHPPENLQRTPGPRAILNYLHRDQELQAQRLPLPRSTRTSLSCLAEVRMYPGCTSSFSPPTRASRSSGRDSTRFQGCDQRAA